MPEAIDWLDKLTEKRGARPWVLLVLLSAALFLPLLGRYGLWDPHEVRVAEIAREMAHTHTWVVPARFSNKPVLLLEAISAGYRYLGSSEIAGRLPVALLSIATVLACFYAGGGLLRRRAALLGTLCLLTMPVFFLGARQLTSAVGPLLASALAIGGLGRAAWPDSDESPLLHLLVGVAGLALGQLACGFGLGVAVPLLAVAVALWASGPSGGAAIAGAPDGPGGFEAPPAGAAEAPATGMTLPRLLFTATAVAAVVAVYLGWSRSLPGAAHPGYSWIVGGAPRVANHQIQATTLLKAVGFGAFPWIVVAPLGVARLFARRDDDQGDGVDREGYGRYLLLAWGLLAYLGTTLFLASVGETSYPGFVAVALLAGAFLDDLLDSDGGQPVAALVAIAGGATITHDFFMAPEGMLGAHVLEGIKWPSVVTAPTWFILGAGLLWTALVAAALALPGGRPAWLPSRSRLALGAMGTACLLTVASIYWIVPTLSQHLSMKGLFVKYKAIVGTGSSPIGKYHVQGELSDYGKTTDITSLPQLFEFLTNPDRVFVITAADDLPAIDQYAKQRSTAAPAASSARAADYFVIDDSNSKYLMLSNKLGGEQDKNPLRRFVLPVSGGLPRRPQHEVQVDLEGKIQILGYDVPDEVERGKPFKMTVYYQVKQPIPGNYKIFHHFDGAGARFNGDHTPLDGKFPTNYWVPGFYIIDEYTITPDRVTTPSGYCTVYTGFWSGDQRLKVVAGPADSDNRVKLGIIKVK